MTLNRWLFLSYDTEICRRAPRRLFRELGGEGFALAQLPETVGGHRAHGLEAGLIADLLGWRAAPPPERVPVASDAEPRVDEPLAYELRLAGATIGSEPWQRLRDDAARLAARFEALLERWRPNALIVWNGHTLPWSVCLPVARRRGLAVHSIERGLFPRSIFCDALGVGALASVAGCSYEALAASATDVELAAAAAHVAALRREPFEEILAGRPTGPVNAAELPVSPGARVGLIVGQVDHDTNAVLFSRRCRRAGDLLHLVGDAAAAVPDLELFYRPHPRARPLRAALPAGIRLAPSGPLGALLRRCDFVITRNSTVGFEALLQGKACITLGRALYAGRGLTHEPRDAAELASRLAALAERPELTPQQEEKLTLLTARLLSQHFFLEPRRPIEREASRRVVETLRVAAAKVSPDGSHRHSPLPARWRVRLATTRGLRDASENAQYYGRALKRRLWPKPGP